MEVNQEHLTWEGLGHHHTCVFLIPVLSTQRLTCPPRFHGRGDLSGNKSRYHVETDARYVNRYLTNASEISNTRSTAIETPNELANRYPTYTVHFSCRFSKQRRSSKSAEAHGTNSRLKNGRRSFHPFRGAHHPNRHQGRGQ
jgi:hypothetical protein